MDYYDVLFARSLNKGGDTPTPTPTPSGIVNQPCTVTFVNNTLYSKHFYALTVIHDNFIEMADIKVNGHETVVKQLFPIPYFDNYETNGALLIDECPIGVGEEWTASNETNCELYIDGGYGSLWVVDPTKPSSITITISSGEV